MDKIYDIAILGSGPGGYVSAIRAAQLGLSVCLIEKHKLGGVCLNAGCIPTKTLLKSAHLYQSLQSIEDLGVNLENLSFDLSVCQKRKTSVVEQLKKGIEFILKKRGVDIVYGAGRIISKDEIKAGDQNIKFKNCIIATGSRPAQLPAISFNPSGGIVSSDELLEVESVPKSLLVIGGGVIGCEFADIFNSIGSEITIVELAGQLLPNEDAEVSRALTISFKKRGIKILTSTSIQELSQTEGDLEAITDIGQKISVEKVLLSVGRTANTQDSGIEEIGINIENGRIIVNEYMQTNIDNFYAIGDVVGKMWLAHVASAEGKKVVENIAGEQAKIDYTIIPRCIYTYPQIASVGMTEKQAREKGNEIKVGKFPFSACGKAMVEKSGPGFIKLLIDADNNKIIGASLFGDTVTEIISQVCIAMQSGLTADELANIVFAHPTLSETIMEAAEAVQGRAIHVI
ncbi:MAG: dihydrolipoyl dehydrogenase [PVC group bacterium]|nr:dihydrolipoyl dehydrogenase [PVC group bacterium]